MKHPEYETREVAAGTGQNSIKASTFCSIEQDGRVVYRGQITDVHGICQSDVYGKDHREIVVAELIADIDLKIRALRVLKARLQGENIIE